MSALREVLASFFVEVSDEELIKAGKHVEGFIGKLRSVIPVLTEAFAVGAFAEFIDATLEAGAHMDDLANKLGLGTTELQQFQYAAKLAGVDSETAAHSLGFLNKAVGEALTGSKEAADTFAKLHVPLKDSSGAARETGDILLDVSDALEKLPDQQTRAAYAMELFGREGQALLPVLGQGSAKLREVYGEFGKLGGGMSEDFVKKAKETQDQIDKVKVSLDAIRVRLVAAVIPAVQWLTAKVKAIVLPLMNWIDHTNILKTGLLALSAVLAGKTVLSVIKLARVLGFLKATARETLVAFAEFAVPLALAGLLYLAFDDFFTLLDGGDSEIGHILETLGGLEGKNKFVDDLYDSWDLLSSLWGGDAAADADAITGKVEEQKSAFEYLAGGLYEIVVIVKTVFDLFLGLTKVIGTTVAGVGKFVQAIGKLSSSGEGDKGFMDQLSDLGSAASGAFSDAGKAVDQTGDLAGNDLNDIWNPGNHPATADAAHQAKRDRRALSRIKDGAEEDLASPGAGSVSVGALQPAGGGGVQVGQLVVHVTAGKDPEQTGKRVAQSAATELERQNRDAAANLKRM